MRRACAIMLTDDDRATLERWSRSRSTEARLVERARVVRPRVSEFETKRIGQGGPNVTSFPAPSKGQ